MNSLRFLKNLKNKYLYIRLFVHYGIIFLDIPMYIEYLVFYENSIMYKKYI